MITDMRINFISENKPFNINDFTLQEIDYFPKSFKITKKKYISIVLTNCGSSKKYCRFFYINSYEAVELIIKIRVIENKNKNNNIIKGEIIHEGIVATIKNTKEKKIKNIEEYQKEYYKQNKAKLKKYQREYYYKNKK